MKNLIKIIGLSLVFAVIMVSCKSKKNTATQVLAAYKDSVEYSEFVQWKAQKAQQEKMQQERVVKYQAPAATTPAANTTPAVTPRKKGWSKAAKGTVIGGASGAVIGAVINKKNRGVGAVVGGLFGAGVGYGVGRAQDKKDGRNQ